VYAADLPTFLSSHATHVQLLLTTVCFYKLYLPYLLTYLLLLPYLSFLYLTSSSSIPSSAFTSDGGPEYHSSKMFEIINVHTGMSFNALTWFPSAEDCNFVVGFKQFWDKTFKRFISSLHQYFMALSHNVCFCQKKCIEEVYSPHRQQTIITMTINEHAKTDMYMEHYIKY